MEQWISYSDFKDRQKLKRVKEAVIVEKLLKKGNLSNSDKLFILSFYLNIKNN